ncbi:MAG TPA: ABC transporter substrate-binding protein, partial [Natronosporangium sp.]|nr:ABC transporter substrate-binding protein [Natronosporangium sp.]
SYTHRNGECMRLSTVAVSRRTFGAGMAAVSAAATGLLAACGVRESTARSRRSTRVTYLTSFGDLGRECYVHVARAKGFFAAQDLEVTVEPGAGTGPNLQALLSGQAQFATLDLAGAIVARGEGVTGFVAIAAIHQLPLAAMMAVDPAITHPLDLRGRSVGLLAGAVTELLFPPWAEQAGLDPRQVEQVPLSAAELVGALVSGRVDAIGQYLVGRPLVEAATGRPVTSFPFGDYLHDLYGNGLFTTTDLARRDPDLCRRFRDGLLAGLSYAVAHPGEAAEILHRVNPAADPEVAAEELRLLAPYVSDGPTNPVGSLELARLARGAALLQSIGAVPDWVEPAELAAADLLPVGGAA